MFITLRIFLNSTTIQEYANIVEHKIVLTVNTNLDESKKSNVLVITNNKSKEDRIFNY